MQSGAELPLPMAVLCTSAGAHEAMLIKAATFLVVLKYVLNGQSNREMVDK